MNKWKGIASGWYLDKVTDFRKKSNNYLAHWSKWLFFVLGDRDRYGDEGAVLLLGRSMAGRRRRRQATRRRYCRSGRWWCRYSANCQLPSIQDVCQSHHMTTHQHRFDIGVGVHRRRARCRYRRQSQRRTLRRKGQHWLCKFLKNTFFISFFLLLILRIFTFFTASTWRSIWTIAYREVRCQRSRYWRFDQDSHRPWYVH